jgi:hypothetical protein
LQGEQLLLCELLLCQLLLCELLLHEVGPSCLHAAQLHGPLLLLLLKLQLQLLLLQHVVVQATCCKQSLCCLWVLHCQQLQLCLAACRSRCHVHPVVDLHHLQPLALQQVLPLLLLQATLLLACCQRQVGCLLHPEACLLRKPLLSAGCKADWLQ